MSEHQQDKANENKDIAPVQSLDKPADLANQALMEALQISFRILKVIMLILVAFFLFSGMFEVQPNEVGMVVRFGNVVGTGPERELQSGFHWSLPYPIDQQIRIPKGRLRQAKVHFWYNITDQERLRGPSKQVGKSLHPGADEYAISGDANIVHLTATVKYRIVNAYEYVRNLYGSQDLGTPGEQYPERDLLDALARNAVIKTAATFDVDGLMSERKAEFTSKIARILGSAIAKLDCGLELDSVLIDRIAPPRQVVGQFNKVRDAAQERSTSIDNAIGDAKQLLTRAAGAGYQQLLDAIAVEQQAAGADIQTLPQASDKVRELLLQSQGTVQEILADAEVYYTTVVTQAKADADYLQLLLPEYRKNPRVVLTRLLLGTLEEVLPKVKKWYIPSGVGQVRYVIDRDPQELSERSSNEDQDK